MEILMAIKLPSDFHSLEAFSWQQMPNKSQINPKPPKSQGFSHGLFSFCKLFHTYLPERKRVKTIEENTDTLIIRQAWGPCPVLMG